MLPTSHLNTLDFTLHIETQNSNMKKSEFTALFLCFLLISATLAARPGSDKSSQEETTRPKKGGGNDGGFGDGSGFNIPGFGNGGFGPIGGGYGYGYGGPNGGHSKGGIVRPSVVCEEKGPCYEKRLTCPAKCFSSYSHAGKGYGGGGGGGGCTIDCTKKCAAYC